jgi:hypothetical protein
VATDIVREGRLESAPSIDRGEPILHSEAEWRHRSRPYRRSIDLSWLAINAVVVGVPLILLIAALVFKPDFVLIPLVVLVLSIMITAFAVFSVIAHLYDRKEVATTPPEGLYERGVQLFYFIFVPYEEISSVNRSLVKGRPTIELRLHSHEDESIKERQPKVWTLQLDFLGDDGVRALEARVHSAGSPE